MAPLCQLTQPCAIPSLDHTYDKAEDNHVSAALLLDLLNNVVYHGQLFDQCATLLWRCGWRVARNRGRQNPNMLALATPL